MSWLLDVNALLASRWKTHADHEAVREWLETLRFSRNLVRYIKR